MGIHAQALVATRPSVQSSTIHQCAPAFKVMLAIHSPAADLDPSKSQGQSSLILATPHLVDQMRSAEMANALAWLNSKEILTLAADLSAF